MDDSQLDGQLLTEETMTGLRIDCCMSRGVMGTPGELLWLTYDDKRTVVEAGLADGSRRAITEDIAWR